MKRDHGRGVVIKGTPRLTKRGLDKLIRAVAPTGTFIPGKGTIDEQSRVHPASGSVIGFPAFEATNAARTALERIRYLRETLSAGLRDVALASSTLALLAEDVRTLEREVPRMRDALLAVQPILPKPRVPRGRPHG